jgi:ADP-ribosylglycohydrolase
MGHDSSLLFQKVYGCLVGGLIGDAMGAPAEGLHYDEVAARFGELSEFQGTGTDDSAIRLILVDAILKNDGHVTADELAESFLRNKEKYYRLFFIPVKNMLHKVESRLSLPVYAGLGNMHSSSSAMAISPMGIVNACDPRQAATETFDVAGLIHAGDATFCRDGACAIAAAVAEAMKVDATVGSVLEAAIGFLHPISSAEMIESIRESVTRARRTGDYERFRKAFYETSLRDIISDSRETVPCALSLFYLAKGDPVKAIGYGANFGRDADTIATMVGAIAGAYAGASAFPEHWLATVEGDYGTQQPVSKDYGVPATEAPDQRRIAEALIGVIQHRTAERRAALAALERLHKD